MKVSNFEKVIFVILLILFVTCSSNGQCNCTIATYDSVKVDSIMRSEQLNIMQLQKRRVYGFDVDDELNCSRLKLEAIEQRKRKIKKLIKC